MTLDMMGVFTHIHDQRENTTYPEEKEEEAHTWPSMSGLPRTPFCPKKPWGNNITTLNMFGTLDTDIIMKEEEEKEKGIVKPRRRSKSYLTACIRLAQNVFLPKKAMRWQYHHIEHVWRPGKELLQSDWVWSFQQIQCQVHGVHCATYGVAPAWLKSQLL